MGSKILGIEEARQKRQEENQAKNELARLDAELAAIGAALPKCLYIGYEPGFPREDYIEVLQFHIRCIKAGALVGHEAEGS